MKKLVWAGAVLLSIGVVLLGIRSYQLWSNAAVWDAPVEEILSERLTKDAETMEIEFTSRIDSPVEDVLGVFSEPERSAEFSDTVRVSKLLQASGNRKVVEFEMSILGRPQQMSLAFTFLPEERLVTVETVESQLMDLVGQYRFTPSPDGTKTLLVYSGTARDKISMPVPLALQKSALRETFTSTVRALKKALTARTQAGMDAASG